MSDMLYKCSSLSSLNLSNFNTNNVTYMSDMFYGMNMSCNLIFNDDNILIEFSNKF